MNSWIIAAITTFVLVLAGAIGIRDDRWLAIVLVLFGGIGMWLLVNGAGQ